MAKVLAIPDSNLGQCPPSWKCAGQGWDAFDCSAKWEFRDVRIYYYPSNRPPVELVSLAAKRSSADPGDLVE